MYEAALPAGVLEYLQPYIIAKANGAGYLESPEYRQILSVRTPQPVRCFWQQ